MKNTTLVILSALGAAIFVILLFFLPSLLRPF